MSALDKKQAIEAWKKRDVDAGIFAVRCAATGEAWVGGWPDVDRVRNRIWFTLGQGSHPNRSLQAAWRAHGPEVFTFEVLERLEPCEESWARDAQLKERAAFWRARIAGASL
ncbi:GIY-YIG nuclease family protein [Camelimonas sp. ID_303_24]